LIIHYIPDRNPPPKSNPAAVPKIYGASIRGRGLVSFCKVEGTVIPKRSEGYAFREQPATSFAKAALFRGSEL
jgi:hypothetical protein